jgi:hypothetical protein
MLRTERTPEILSTNTEDNRASPYSKSKESLDPSGRRNYGLIINRGLEHGV